MEAADIPVSKVEQFSTLRHVIKPESQEDVPEIMIATHRMMREGKFSGCMRIEWNEGGVRFIQSDQFADEFNEEENS